MFKRLTSHEKWSILHLLLGASILLSFIQEVFYPNPLALDLVKTSGWRSLANVALFLSFFPMLASIYYFNEKDLDWSVKRSGFIRSFWIVLLALAIQVAFQKASDLFSANPDHYIFSFKEDLYYKTLFRQYGRIFFRYAMMGIFVTALDYGEKPEEKEEKANV